VTNNPKWLPALILLDDFGGNWSNYVEAVYAVFQCDFIKTQPRFRNFWVRCRREPLEQGKEAGFWHCISGGPNETERKPEPRRMERIGWVRAVIEHDNTPAVDVWQVMRGTDLRSCIWFNEEFLVVLAWRVRKPSGFKYWQLVTAYDTPEENRKRQLRKARDEWRSKNS